MRMHYTRQIQKDLALVFYYFYILFIKANHSIWWTGVKKNNPSQNKILWTPKDTNIWLLNLQINLPEKYQTFQLSRPSTSQMKLMKISLEAQNYVLQTQTYLEKIPLNINYLLPFHLLQLHEVVRWSGRQIFHMKCKPLSDFVQQKMLCVENDHVVENW